MDKKLIIGAVALAGVLLMGGALETPARDLGRDEALAILARAGVLLRKESSEAGTVRVSSHLGGVAFRYIGTDRGAEEVDPRMGVMLLRLGQWLARRGVRYVDHLGIYPGSSSDPNEMHNRGFAADLAKFTFNNGETLSVLKDWGQKPKSGPGYRLHPGDKGYSFFLALYDWLSSEAEAGGRIGEHGFLITPDHADPKLAADHADHFHVQIAH